ncbi:hypothetical protein C922_05206 [Plasmodium inui San Antonio 1]|uniref:Uncharacterized protein n=1 Tax=Plasmodium inui San Antonio 1 TaxID=1237626 RepID=W6ZTY4_9APIC|nr:hypothetical protein C922_05206 [Plasmodium inui San Antonio 1]EUD64407.1 hypothetical protein C922_05206 [Plasmodium inui San Antonio 1]
MASFTKWIQGNLEEGAKRHCKGLQGGKESEMTVCGLVEGRLKEGQSSVSGRWMSILAKNNSKPPNLATAASIICRDIEKWTASLIPEEANDVWSKSGCSIETLGVRGRITEKKTCQWDNDKVIWPQISLSAELDSHRTNNRSLMICMDMVSIILTIFRNLDIKDHGITYRDKDVCQSLYEEFKDWGGEEVAEEVMSFWFPLNTRGVKIGGREYKNPKRLGGTWKEAFYLYGNPITGVQCSRARDGVPKKYMTSCYWKSQGDNCESGNDTTWVEPQVKTEEERKAQESSILNSEADPVLQKWKELTALEDESGQTRKTSTGGKIAGEKAPVNKGDFKRVSLSEFILLLGQGMGPKGISSNKGTWRTLEESHVVGVFHKTQGKGELGPDLKDQIRNNNHPKGPEEHVWT